MRVQGNDLHARGDDLRTRIDALGEQGLFSERMAHLDGLVTASAGPSPGGPREARGSEPYPPPPAASSAREPAIMFIIP